MEDKHQDSLQKKFCSLGEEMVEVVRETNEGVSEVTPSIMHNLIRIFYEFLNRLLNIQGLSPTKNLDHEIKRIDDRISESRQVVERTETQIKEVKDSKSKKLLENKLNAAREEFSYLEHVKDILDEDGNRKNLVEFLDNMLYLVYGSNKLDIKEFRDIGQKMTQIISVMTGSRRSASAPVDMPVADITVKERGMVGKFLDHLAEVFTQRFGRRRKRVEGLPEEAEPVVHGVMAKFVGLLKRKEPVKQPAENPDEAIEAALKSVPEAPKGFFSKMKDKLSLEANPEEVEADMDHLSMIKDEMEHLGEKEIRTIPVIQDDIDYLHQKDEELKTKIMDNLSSDDLVVVVKSFVSQKRGQGFSDSSIRAALKEKKWPLDIIKKGLSA